MSDRERTSQILKTMKRSSPFVVIIIAVLAGWLLELPDSLRQTTGTQEMETPVPTVPERTSHRSPEAAAFSAKYQEARHYFHSNQLDKAEQAFTDAIALATDPFQEWQPRYRLATLPAQRGDRLTSVDMLKQVAASSTSEAVAARATEHLARLYLYGGYGEDVYEKIFSGPIYEGLRDPKSRPNSFKNLYELAASYYPSSFSEIQLALWHSEQLLEGKHTLPQEEVLAIIEAHEQKALADFNVIYRGNPNNGNLPETLLLDANLSRNLAVLGLRDPSIAEQKYQDALKLDQSNDSKDVGVLLNYHYAVFIAKTSGESRSADIQANLSKIYNGKSDVQIARLIKYLAAHDPAGEVEMYRMSEYDAVKTLAGFDKRFKHYAEERGFQF